MVVVLGLRTASQERELSRKRLVEDGQRWLERVKEQLLARLEEIRSQELAVLTDAAAASRGQKYSGDCREISLRVRRESSWAIIDVADQGVGIAKEEHNLIFEKFYRVSTPENWHVPGTGLGLTLVAHIASAHGGSVKVQSAPGRGSTFSLYLPLENDS